VFPASERRFVQVSQKNGRDLDPDHHMWLEYMRARRTKGAGYMHPEMKAEMERIDRLINGPDNSPMCVAVPCPLDVCLCTVLLNGRLPWSLKLHHHEFLRQLSCDSPVRKWLGGGVADVAS
jgi:hypothetical protein